MKIAAVLFILSVCYIASTEQAAAPAGMQRGMEEFNMKAEAFSENAKL